MGLLSFVRNLSSGDGDILEGVRMGLLSFVRNLSSGDGDILEDKDLRLKIEKAVYAAEDDKDNLVSHVRRRYRFTGTVQGVGFRWTTTKLADAVGATGWVRNELDGSVTTELQGVVEQIDAVIEGLERQYNKRHYLGGFTIADVTEESLVSGETGFRSIY